VARILAALPPPAHLPRPVPAPAPGSNVDRLFLQTYGGRMPEIRHMSCDESPAEPHPARDHESVDALQELSRGAAHAELGTRAGVSRAKALPGTSAGALGETSIGRTTGGESDSREADQ